MFQISVMLVYYSIILVSIFVHISNFKVRRLIQKSFISFSYHLLAMHKDIFYTSYLICRKLKNLYVILWSHTHQKLHVKNSSIFRRFWKSSWRRVIHIKSMSSFPRGFVFYNRWNIEELLTWNFNVESTKMCPLGINLFK